VIHVERSLHLFWEQGIQEDAMAVPGLMSVLGVAYMSLHAGATIAVLVWLYRRHREVFPAARTALIVATALGIVVHVAFPTAQPRLIGLTAGAVTTTHVNLNSHLLGALYNPIVAVPSMHFGYAVLVGALVAKLGRTSLVRCFDIA
jgi:PAP2 superfamily